MKRLLVFAFIIVGIAVVALSLRNGKEVPKEQKTSQTERPAENKYNREPSQPGREQMDKTTEEQKLPRIEQPAEDKYNEEASHQLGREQMDRTTEEQKKPQPEQPSESEDEGDYEPSLIDENTSGVAEGEVVEVNGNTVEFKDETGEIHSVTIGGVDNLEEQNPKMFAPGNKIRVQILEGGGSVITDLSQDDATTQESTGSEEDGTDTTDNGEEIEGETDLE